jgi:beta-N-acetylhexosaminidase
MHLNSQEERLYQLIIGRLDGEMIGRSAYEEKIMALVRKGIGGFILFGGNRDEIKRFLRYLQTLSGTRLFVASDIERGMGQQAAGATVFPCQMAIAAAINRDIPEHVSLLEDAIRAIALEAKDAGINMPLIPVLDVNRNPDNPIICTRSFSDDPEEVSWFGSEYVRGLQREGLLSCAKHFPGHGDTATDSHISLPVIAKPYKLLMETDVAPFVKAIESDVMCIMVGHLNIPEIDPLPASLSGKVIALLRDQLGFAGLILTDALTMNALSGRENAPIECLHAGSDILLHPEEPDKTVRQLLSAVGSRMLPEARIDTAINRILKTKERLTDEKIEAADYSRHAGLSEMLTKMSVTLVKQSAGILPITDPGKCKVAFAGDEHLFEFSPFKDASYIPPSFHPPLPERQEGRIETLIIAIFTSISAWKGSSGIERNEEERLLELIRKAHRSVVISFGSPYVLSRFREADMLIAAYDPTNMAQRAVIRCLKGELEFRGRLPVKIGLAAT